MQAQPLPKAIHDKAKELGVTTIELQFSGGSDEGYLSVGLDGPEFERFADGNLADEIEEWAWSVYQYSGAGDGSDYGDDIIYDLEAMTIATSGWAMTRHDCASEFEGGALHVTEEAATDDTV